MSESAQPSVPPEIDPGGDEEVDGLPVLAGRPQVLGRSASTDSLPGERHTGAVVLPAVQAAAVAAGGFVAGAAVVGLMHHRQRRSAALTRGRKGARELSRRGAGRAGKAGDGTQIVGSRSFLVDVHLLGGPGGNR